MEETKTTAELEKCLKCGELVHVSGLRKHMENCSCTTNISKSPLIPDEQKNW